MSDVSREEALQHAVITRMLLEEIAPLLAAVQSRVPPDLFSELQRRVQSLGDISAQNEVNAARVGIKAASDVEQVRQYKELAYAPDMMQCLGCGVMLAYPRGVPQQLPPCPQCNSAESGPVLERNLRKYLEQRLTIAAVVRAAYAVTHLAAAGLVADELDDAAMKRLRTAVAHTNRVVVAVDG